ncbi:MAG TPA: ABC transporter permease subunit [Actinomycetes bacterium]|nr:ABC transporter permease subunit [Actinomycetes bacterium]
MRLGRGHIARSLFLHSLRGSYGIGRGARAKILPFAVLAIMCAPAAVAVVIASQTGTQEIRYDAYPFMFQLLIVIFLAAQAPEMLSRDLRHHVLPLYFSRPLRRDDYALAKLGAMTTALFALIAIPLLVLFAGIAFTLVSKPGELWTETTELVPGLANAGVHALVLAAAGLAISSFASRRAYATGAVAGLYVISQVVADIVRSAPSQAVRERSGLLTPFDLLEGFKQWALRGTAVEEIDIGGAGWLYGLVTVALLVAAVAVLLARYRRVAA